MAAAPAGGDLQAAIDAIRIIDAHEHLETETDRLSAPIDFSRLFSPHAGADLVAAGMAPRDVSRFLSSEADPDEKWRLIAPFWPFTRFTGFGQAVRRAVRDLYGCEDLTAATYAPLTEAMQAANRPGIHRHVIQERAGIERCLVHNLEGAAVLFREPSDVGTYCQDLGLQPFLTNALPVEALSQQSGLPIGSLRELLRVIDWSFSRYGDRAVAITNNCAYWRTLRFDDVTQGQAESLFERGYVAQEGLSSSETKALQDFLFHYCIRCAIDYRLPVKIHTGYLDGNNRIDMTRIRAIDLIPLFRKYPQARFVLLQIGYPYQHELLVLAKHFTNVYVALSGAWALDSEAARRFVRQWIAAAPANKLIGFGGSAFFADVVYGQARMAREGLARALIGLIDEGVLSRAEAEEIASRVLRENAWSLFRLDDKC